MSETPQPGHPDAEPPTRPADPGPDTPSGAAATPQGPPTRWQRTRQRSRPSTWTRRTAVVVSGIVGLVVGVLLAGLLFATTPAGHSVAGGRADRVPGAAGGRPGDHWGPGPRGDRGDGRGGPRDGQRPGAAAPGASGPIVVQVQPGATVQVAPGATVQTVPGAPAPPTPPAAPAPPAAPVPG